MSEHENQKALPECEEFEKPKNSTEVIKRSGRVIVTDPTENILEIKVFDNNGTLIDIFIYSNIIALTNGEV